MRGGGRRYLRSGTTSAATLALCLILALALAVAPGRAPAAGGTSPTPFGFGSNWTVYHQNRLSSGVDPAGTDLDSLLPAWTSMPLDGGVFGEPLVDQGRILVATEDDTVYELAANSGAVLWSTHLGNPVPVRDLSCPSVVQPLVGITGTPYIDTARHEVFVVAMEETPFGIQHRLYGLDLGTGGIDLDQGADPVGSNPSTLLQRTGLTASRGSLVIGYTGFDDCGNYHGWLVGIPEQGGPLRSFETDATGGERFGGIWMGGAAPVVDRAGDVWIAVSNGSVTKAGRRYDGSNSIVELSPTLVLKQRFGSPSWRADNAADFDLGSTEPVLVDGFAFVVGKAGVAYLTRQKHLGGVGGQVASLDLCRPTRHGGSAWGGTALDGSVLYVNCATGEPGAARFSHLTAVRVSRSAPHLRVLWRATTPGSAGPPIVASGMVWTILLRGKSVIGFNQRDGKPRARAAIGANANHFPTPSVADGLLIVPSGDRVTALAGPAGTPPPPLPAF